MADPFTFFVGVDLGSQSHHVVVLDAAGQNLVHREFQHNGTELGELFSWLSKITNLSPAASIAFAAESPHGAIVESALDRGHAVFSINPKQLDRFRDRFSVAGAKNDQRDAFVLASSLRTDQPCFRLLQLGDARLVLLRELSRAEAQLQEDLRRSANQLWSLLLRYFPSLLQLCSGADESWLWSLLQLAPLPSQAARLKQSQLEKILRQHRIRRFSSLQLADLLRQTPLSLAPGTAEAYADCVVLLLPRLNLIYNQIAQLGSRIDKIIDQLQQDPSFAEHRDIEILRDFPGIGRVFTATVLAEAHKPLAERDYHALRVLGGVAPVTRQSGKTKQVVLRRACNHRVQIALFHSANVFMQKDPRARQQYRSLRQRGHTHARALRGVADRMLALLVILLKTSSFYDVSRRLIAGQEEGTPPQKKA